MRKFPLVLMLLLAFALVGCGSGNDDSDVGVDEQAQKRWPEKGSYTYNYTDTINSVSCSTDLKTFNSKAAYCVGLTNDEFNKGCALSSRKSTYKEKCGDDFEPTQFEGMSV